MAAEEHRQGGARANRRLMMRYRLVETGSWWASPLQDISRSGARFLSEQAFVAGTMLQFELMLPMLKEPLALKGHVVWQKPATMGLTELGVAFDSLEPAAQQALDQAIAFFLRK